MTITTLVRLIHPTPDPDVDAARAAVHAAHDRVEQLERLADLLYATALIQIQSHHTLTDPIVIEAFNRQRDQMQIDVATEHVIAAFFAKYHCRLTYGEEPEKERNAILRLVGALDQGRQIVSPISVPSKRVATTIAILHAILDDVEEQLQLLKQKTQIIAWMPKTKEIPVALPSLVHDIAAQTTNIEEIIAQVQRELAQIEASITTIEQTEQLLTRLEQIIGANPENQFAQTHYLAIIAAMTDGRNSRQS